MGIGSGGGGEEHRSSRVYGAVFTGDVEQGSVTKSSV